MSYSLNRAQIIGNVTRDPESRQTPGGQMVVQFSVATNSTWTDKNGQRQEKAEFHNIVVWGKLAEICSQYLSKGRKVYVEGRMQTREWQGEDGVKRYRTEIIASNVILLDRAGGGSMPSMDEPASESAPRSKNRSSQSMEELQEEPVSLDDLPF